MMTTLDVIRVDLSKSREALLREAGLIPDHLFTTAPSEGAWSAAEILDHLGLVEGRICNGFARTIEGAPAASADYSAPDAADVISSVVTIMKAQASGPLKSTVAPEGGKSRSQLLATLDETRSTLLGLIDDAHGLDLTGRAFPHPIFGPLSPYQWLVFVGLHEDRHRAQITRLRNDFQSRMESAAPLQ